MFDMTYAQAVGEVPMSPLSFVPGTDFDPSDPDEVELVLEASKRDRYDRMAALERENDRLRSLLDQRD